MSHATRAIPGWATFTRIWAWTSSFTCSSQRAGSGSGTGTSASTASSISSASSSLLETCAYSDAGPVSSSCAIRRMVTASKPSFARTSRAVFTTSSWESAGFAARRPGGRRHGGGGTVTRTLYLTRTAFVCRTVFVQRTTFESGDLVTTAEADVRAVLDRLAQAWNDGDATAYGRLFTEDADYVTFFGLNFPGREAIEESHRALFEGPLKGSKLTGRLGAAAKV